MAASEASFWSLPQGGPTDFPSDAIVFRTLFTDVAECSFGLLIQLFLRYPEESYAARSGGASKRVAEQHPLSLVHPEMHGKDFVDGPLRHGIGHEHRARGYVVSRSACALYSRSHLSDRDSARRREAPSDQISCVARVQAFGSVIGLLRPRRVIFLDELHAAAVDDLQLTARCAEDNQRGPP